METKTMTERERMYKRIAQHGDKLNAIQDTGLDSVTLCKKLRRLELEASRWSVLYCNGEIETEDFELVKERVSAKVHKLFGGELRGFKFNSDPRGYALKIDDAYMREHNLDLYRDWGGYGILAPEFDGEA